MQRLHGRTRKKLTITLTLPYLTLRFPHPQAIQENRKGISMLASAAQLILIAQFAQPFTSDGHT
jgi:hypothetical protein